MPTFHNPTGRTMTLREREELADRIVEHELTVIEDDPYGLLRLDGEPQPYLHRMLHDRGAGELAVLMSSFSKSVAPGLRVGYLVLPAALVAPIEALAASTYVSPPLLAQAQLYEFLAAGQARAAPRERAGGAAGRGATRCSTVLDGRAERATRPGRARTAATSCGWSWPRARPRGSPSARRGRRADRPGRRLLPRPREASAARGCRSATRRPPRSTRARCGSPP